MSYFSKKMAFRGLFIACVVSSVLFFVGSANAAYTFTSNGIELSRAAYDYAPSIIVDGTTTKMWWCGAKPPLPGGEVYDGVYYSSKTGGGAWSTPQLVLQSSLTDWENGHLCDPAVIKSSFTVNSINYSYVMYYGAADRSGQHTKIGAAFSNDGINWTKYGTGPIIIDAQGVYEYSIGMPSVYSTGGSNVTMVYFDSRRNNQAMIRTSTNGYDFNATTPYRLPFSSLDTFADIAYSTSESKWYLATKNQVDGSYDGTGHNDHESYVFRSHGSTLQTQDWTYVGKIDTALTGYRLNHNAGFYRSNIGDMYESSGSKYIAYGAQTGNPSVDDPGYWDIGKTTIAGSFSSESTPGSFSLSSPVSGAVIDPLATDVFTWTSSANATSYVITISESNAFNPSDSGNATPIISTIHAAGYEGLKTSFNTGQITNRLALRPNKTYYWKVKALNSAGGVIASNGPFTFTTTDFYRWDFSGNGNNSAAYGTNDKQWRYWNTEGGAARQEVNNGRGIFDITSTTHQIRLGGMYNPIRAELDTKNKIIIKMKNNTSATQLTLSYVLQDDPYPFDEYPARWTTVTFNVVPNDTVFREYVFDMTGNHGWGTAGKLLAWLRLNFNGTGKLEIDDVQITGNNFARTDIADKVLRTGATASSSYSASYPAANAIDGHTADIWISTGHVSESFTESLTLDTGKVEKITKVRFTPRNDGEGVPKDFTIQLSQNGTSWTTVVTQTNYAVVTTEQVFTITASDARYIKFNATKLRANGGGTYLLEIAELHADRDITNLKTIANADFESGLSSWLLWSSNGNTSLDTIQTYGTGTLSGVNGSNQYAAVFEATGNVSGSYSRTISGLTAGATYKVTVFAAANGRDARLLVRNYGGSELSAITTNTTWTPISLNVTLSGGYTSLEVLLYGPASGNIYSYSAFDNVEVVKQ